MANELEETAKKRVQARMGFVVHVSMYVVTNIALIAIWYLTGSGYPWFVWPMMGWGIGIVAHAVGMLVGPGSSIERRAIDTEMRRLRGAPH